MVCEAPVTFEFSLVFVVSCSVWPLSGSGWSRHSYVVSTPCHDVNGYCHFASGPSNVVLGHCHVLNIPCHV